MRRTSSSSQTSGSELMTPRLSPLRMTHHGQGSNAIKSDGRLRVRRLLAADRVCDRPSACRARIKR